ncbi:MAG: cytochrome c maturation protein CcmE [Cyclobacteriaceae bacterium]
MKKTHIIGLVVIAVALMIIISTAGDASTYVSFNEAQEMAEKGNNNKIHVVGKLKKDHDGNVINIETSPDNRSFRFALVDENNNEQMVYHPNPMPTDFLRSEQVVVVGAYNNDRFVADKILLKCPSKYQEEGVNL